MLSVGREINIRGKDVVCRECGWEGAGSQLATGLVSIDPTSIYLYAYRCPNCSSFDVARKGKLLRFRLPSPPGEEREDLTTRKRSMREG